MRLGFDLKIIIPTNVTYFSQGFIDKNQYEISEISADGLCEFHVLPIDIQ